MKDFTQHELEGSRPDMQPRAAIDFCLKALYRDTEHSVEDDVVRHLSFEELIGTLLLARDVVDERHGT